MSDRPPPTLEIDPISAPRAASPMRGAIIGGVGVAAIIGLALLFSGNLPGLHRKEQQQEPPKIQVSPVVTPVVRPAEPSVAAPTPQQQRQLMLRQVNPVTSDQDKAARESPMVGFALKGGSAAAAVAGKSGGEGDPDAIPPNGRPDALEASLQPTKMNGTRVAELPNPRWLIEEGRILRCIQQTRINTTLPGAVTAIINEEIRGETGDVVLLPKGAKVFGTIQHGLLNGLDRAAVLWQDITTPVLYDERGMPHQFRVAVNSPAASERGETGVDGDVNRHLFNPFPGKLGGIIGLSLIRGGIDMATQYLGRQQGNGNSQTNLNFNSFQQGGQGAADELLRSYIQIPDVMTRDEGLPCSIFVVRDLDLRGAYTLVQKYRSQ